MKATRWMEKVAELPPYQSDCWALAVAWGIKDRTMETLSAGAKPAQSYRISGGVRVDRYERHDSCGLEDMVLGRACKGLGLVNMVRRSRHHSWKSAFSRRKAIHHPAADEGRRDRPAW